MQPEEWRGKKLYFLERSERSRNISQPLLSYLHLLYFHRRNQFKGRKLSWKHPDLKGDKQKMATTSLELSEYLLNEFYHPSTKNWHKRGIDILKSTHYNLPSDVPKRKRDAID